MARSKAVNAAVKGLVAPGKILFGADDGERHFTGPSGIETQMGVGMGVRNRHWSHGAALPGILTAFEADAAGGHVPMISLGGQGYTSGLVLDIAAGREDAAWTRLFAGLKSPGLFRPWMEMNGSHNSYSASPGAYRAMWVHVHDIYARAGNGNLKWIFCPQVQDPRVADWTMFWPGDGLVDWMGYDLYRHFYSDADPFRVWANQKKLPFSLCETGFQHGVSVKDKGSTRRGDKDGSVTGLSLVDDTRSELKAHPNTVMYLVWNCKGPIGTNYIDTSKASLASYRAFASDPAFQFARQV